MTYAEIDKLRVGDCILLSTFKPGEYWYGTISKIEHTTNPQVKLFTIAWRGSNQLLSSEKGTWHACALNMPFVQSLDYLINNTPITK